MTDLHDSGIGSDTNTTLSEGACILKPVGGSYYPKCVRCGWLSAVGYSSLVVARRSCEHECRAEPKPVGKAWELRASLCRNAVLGAARAWREYRRADGTPSATYASLCADLDRAIDEYQEIIRAY